MEVSQWLVSTKEPFAKKDQENKDQKDQKDQQEKNEKEKQEKEKKELEQQDQKENKEKKETPPSVSNKLKQMEMSEEKAQMILEAMKNQEIQYLQQNKRKATKPKDKGKPDWQCKMSTVNSRLRTVER